MVAVPPTDELVLRVIAPVTAPVFVGSKVILSVADWPGFSDSGKTKPEMPKPVPVNVAALIVSWLVPVEARLTDWVAVELTVTLPKATLVDPSANMAVAAFNCSE